MAGAQLGLEISSIVNIEYQSMHAIVSRSRRFSIAIEPRAEPCDKAFSKFFWLETSGSRGRPTK